MLIRDEYSDARKILAQFDAPAYIRRARRVEDAWEELVARCGRQREEWLKSARLRLGMLAGLAGDWSRVEPFLADSTDASRLQGLLAEWSPRLRVVVARTSSERKLRAALCALRDAIERFNCRWSGFLPGVDLTAINKLRDGYNRFYVLEKECAVRSPIVARQGFQPLPPATVDDLYALFPSVWVPQMRN